MTAEIEGSKTAHRTVGNTHPHSTVLALERELASVKLMHQNKVKELEDQVHSWRAKCEKGGPRPPPPPPQREVKSHVVDENREREMNALAVALEAKQDEVESLKKINKEMEVEKTKLSKLHDERISALTSYKTEELAAENASLKQKVKRVYSALFRRHLFVVVWP